MRQTPVGCAGEVVDWSYSKDMPQASGIRWRTFRSARPTPHGSNASSARQRPGSGLIPNLEPLPLSKDQPYRAISQHNVGSTLASPTADVFALFPPTAPIAAIAAQCQHTWEPAPHVAPTATREIARRGLPPYTRTIAQNCFAACSQASCECQPRGARGQEETPVSS